MLVTKTCFLILKFESFEIKLSVENSPVEDSPVE